MAKLLPCKREDARSKRRREHHYRRDRSTAGRLLGKEQIEVRSLVVAPFCAGSPTGRRRFPQKEDSAGSNPSRRTTCPLSPTVEAAPSKCAKVPVRIRERAPRRSLRQAAKGIGFTSRHFRGSNPRGSTAHLAQWQSIRLTCGRREDRNLGCAPVSGDDSAGEEAALIRQYSAGSTPRSPTMDAKG